MPAVYAPNRIGGVAVWRAQRAEPPAGDATANVTGFSSTAVFGVTTASGRALATVAGYSSTAVLGSTQASGRATAGVLGVSSTPAWGTVTAVASVPAEANVSGWSSTATLGIVTARAITLVRSEARTAYVLADRVFILD